MPVIKSLLKDVLSAFPEKETIKGSNVEAMLKKKGVKQEELDFSGLTFDDAARYDAEGLKKLEAGRKDVIETKVQSRSQFDWVSLHDQATNPTYKEKIITFKQQGMSTNATRTSESVRAEMQQLRDEHSVDPDLLDGDIAMGGEGGLPTAAQQRFADLADEMLQLEEAEIKGRKPQPSRYTSSHFAAQKDYLMHTRVYDDTLDGTPTRVVEELQSDLHQQGRQHGYNQPPDDMDAIDALDEAITAGRPEAEIQALADDAGVPPNADIEDWVVDRIAEMDSGTGGIPVSPYEKTWLRKGIERELVDAMNEGRQQLAIPIKGSIGKLQRGAGVQRWYETQVLNTAKKVAKASGSDFEVKRIGSGKLENFFEPKEMTQLVKFLGEMTDANKGQAIDDMLQNPRIAGSAQVVSILNEIKSGAMKPMDAYKALAHVQQESGVEYAIIKPKGDLQEGTKPGLRAAAAELDKQLVELEKQGFSAGTPEFDALLAKKIKFVVAGDRAGVTTFRAKPMSFSLYSTPVAGAFAAYAAFKQGASDEELTTYLTEQGQDEDEIAETIAKARQIESAINSGATEDEVKEYLMNQQPQVQKVETMDELSPERAMQILETEDSGWSSIFTPYAARVDIPESLIDEETKKLVDAQKAKFDAQEDGFWKNRAMGYAKTESGLRLEAATNVLDNLRVKAGAYADLTSGEDMELTEFVAKMETVYPNIVSVLDRTTAWAGNEDNMRIAKQAELASRLQIIKQAQKLGVTLEYVGEHGLADEDSPRPDIGVITDAGRWEALMPDGTRVDASPSFWQSLEAEKSELGLAVAGGFMGAKLGLNVPGGPRVKALSSLLGSIAGASGLSAIGSQADYMTNAIQLQQNLDSSIAGARARDAAQASALGDAIVFPVFKAVGLYRQLRDGDVLGANKALKEMMALSDDEAAAIVQQAERVIKLEGSQSGKEISSFITTQPGGETIMNVIGTIDTMAKRIVSLDIDKRAKDLIKTSGELVPDRIDKVLSQDLDNYVTDVKAFYGSVKAQAANTPNANKWSFDYAKLGMNPVLDAMQSKIDDVPTLERFMLKAQRIRERADGRTFADLLDLRQMVNGFIYGRGTKKATELTAFRELVKNIDSAVVQGSEVVMENPKQWREHWALARSQYADMKGVEKNVLYKALTAKGVDDTIAVKKMVRYITSGDETWTDVMAALPEKTRASAEGAVIDALVNKFAKGEGFQAINYPALAEELGRTTFTSPDARKLKGAIERLGAVFKNDILLLDQSGGLTIPHAAQGLTTDLSAKAHYSLMSSVWTKTQQFLPGKAGRKAALINRAAALLENPLNVKTAKELMEEVGPSVNLSPKVLALQQQAAAEAAKSQPSALVKLYGDGKLLSPKGVGKETKMQVSRIATPDVVAQIAEAEGIAQSNVKALEFALKQRGYQAIVLGTEKVKLL